MSSSFFFKARQYLVFLLLLFFVMPAQAEVIRGVFGVPSIQKLSPVAVTSIKKSGMNAVFVPAERETIQWFKSQGFKVFISVNAFGGTDGWKTNLDEQPIMADGQAMDIKSSKHGGICPTHESWRAERLKHIEDIIKQFGGPGGIDGVWLDFVRYPGFWETPENNDSALERGLKPAVTDTSRRGLKSAATTAATLEGMGKSPFLIPDTCYCPRCLKKFQDDRKIKMPDGLNTKEAAAWIKKHHPNEWMTWKKEQINSFVREVRQIINRVSAGFSPRIQDEGRLESAVSDTSKRGLKSAATLGKMRQSLLLGMFVVPWTKGEKDDAISYLLAQDAFQLSGIVDVISPMVYHKMVGQPESWVGKMTAYYKETTKCEVWPIVQSVDTTQKEFDQVIRYAGQAGADGILVFSYEGMKGKNPPQPPFKKGGKSNVWSDVKEFQPRTNLIRNSEFEIAQGQQRPESWVAGENGDSPYFRKRKMGQSPFSAEERGLKPAATSAGKKAESPFFSTFDIEPARNIDKRIEESKSFNAIGITAGQDREGIWTSVIQSCEPGREYLFTGLFYRDHWADGKYPRIRLWGQEFYLDNHWLYGTFQPIRVYVACPEIVNEKRDSPYFRKRKMGQSPFPAETSVFQFVNDNPGITFWMGRPQLYEQALDNRRLKPAAIDTRKRGLKSAATQDGTDTFKRRLKPAATEIARDFYPGVFPIGVYGADIKNLEQIKKLAINTVIVGGEGENLKITIDSCRQLGLRYVLSAPHDPDRVKMYLDELAEYSLPHQVKGIKKPIKLDRGNPPESPFNKGGIEEHEVAFYVNDEPELRSVPVGQANDVHRLIKDRFPKAPTCMAVVRPKACRDYLESADFFMMDQYPVPFMPMTWLSDSMDEAARIAGKDRLVSVIQAFSGAMGDPDWPRLPTWEEMNCLAFLSIIHGSRGIFFFTFSEIGKTEEGRQRLGRVVGRLNQLYPWLLEKNLDRIVPVRMISDYGVDPKGRPAVQGAIKRRDGRLLFLLVNTIETYVKAEIKIIADFHSSMQKECKEVFSGERYPVINGTVIAKFNPYETKAFELDE